MSSVVGIYLPTKGLTCDESKLAVTRENETSYDDVTLSVMCRVNKIQAALGLLELISSRYWGFIPILYESFFGPSAHVLEQMKQFQS